jgi:hypothetical protein
MQASSLLLNRGEGTHRKQAEAACTTLCSVNERKHAGMHVRCRFVAPHTHAKQGRALWHTHARIISAHGARTCTPHNLPCMHVHTPTAVLPLTRAPPQAHWPPTHHCCTL